MFANEASLKMLSKSDMLQNQTYILHLVIHFEYVLTNKAAFGGSKSHLGLKMRYIGELVGDNNGRNHRPHEISDCGGSPSGSHK